MSDARFLTEAGEPRAFAIVSSARSGSNLLVTYLRQVTRAACFGEILLERFPERAGWPKLIKRLDMPPEEALRLAREDATGFWELFLRQGLRRRQWVGAKVFYYHRRGDPVWSRFEAEDHRVIHLWRDATFDQWVSRALARSTGEWKARDGSAADGEPRVSFDRDDYLAYRETLKADIEATRARFGGSDRYTELEYRQLSDHVLMADLLERWFGERPDVREGLRRQRGRPKIEYLTDPEEAEPFVDDSIRDGFAPG